MPADVFISYARRDWDRVQPWVEQLQAAGVSTWVDVGGIEGASLWTQEITHAIDHCRVLIVMVSSTSAASRQVFREVSLAAEAEKPILPLLLEPVADLQNLRYPLAGVHHLELFEGDRDRQLQATLRSLSGL